MGSDRGVAVWSSTDWLRGAVSWLDSRLAAAGMERTGEVTQPRVRPWGTVLTAPTTGGPVWLKAPGAETVFEVELYQLLHRVVPDRVLRPIAVDVERGWIVLPDGGVPLGERRLDEAELFEALAGVLPQYGQLQRDLAAHVDSLLSFGVTDMRAAVMPERFDQAVTAAGGYVDRLGNAEDREILRRVAARRDTFVAWCERLEAAAVPPSLDHNDLHPWNVFLNGTGARFFDWGDSVVAHPLASMLVGLGIHHHMRGIRVDDPAVRRMRDAYLEPFTDLAPRAELVEELDLACWVAVAARSLTWERAIRAQDGDELSEHARTPLACLEALLADHWMASP